MIQTSMKRRLKLESRIKMTLLTVDIPQQFCPVCFTLLNRTSALTGNHAPEFGDFTICIGCLSILKIGPDFVLEKSSLIEIPVHSRLAFVKAREKMKEMPPLPRRSDPKV